MTVVPRPVRLVAGSDVGFFERGREPSVWGCEGGRSTSGLRCVCRF